MTHRCLGQWLRGAGLQEGMGGQATSRPPGEDAAKRIEALRMQGQVTVPSAEDRVRRPQAQSFASARALPQMRRSHVDWPATAGAGRSAGGALRLPQTL